MKKSIILGLLIALIPTTAQANECDNGCYNYYDPQKQKTITIPLNPKDVDAQVAWYQSMVGIPVWNPPLMGDGSIPKPPEGPWVTADMLP